MRIYVASSWRNTDHHPQVVEALIREKHAVYDFKNPPSSSGFSWAQVSSIPPCDWTDEQYMEAIAHPIAMAGYNSDLHALDNCDACVLVLPCGRSAHLELGRAAGMGKFTIVYRPALERPAFHEPELMYLMCDFITHTLQEVVDTANIIDTVKRRMEEPRTSDTPPLPLREHLARHIVRGLGIQE